MSDDKMFEEYGIMQKTPTELIEEFAAQMMLQHQIYVTEINFNEQNAIDKISSMFKPKERIKLHGMSVNGSNDGEPAIEGPSVESEKLLKVYSSAGRIKLGVKEEVK